MPGISTAAQTRTGLLGKAPMTVFPDAAPGKVLSFLHASRRRARTGFSPVSPNIPDIIAQVDRFCKVSNRLFAYAADNCKHFLLFEKNTEFRGIIFLIIFM